MRGDLSRPYATSAGHPQRHSAASPGPHPPSHRCRPAARSDSQSMIVVVLQQKKCCGRAWPLAPTRRIPAGRDRRTFRRLPSCRGARARLPVSNWHQHLELRQGVYSYHCGVEDGAVNWPTDAGASVLKAHGPPPPTFVRTSAPRQSQTEMHARADIAREYRGVHVLIKVLGGKWSAQCAGPLHV